MRITKLGHCCLLIKENDFVILTDPGNYSTAQNVVTGVRLVLITHEHQDHLHVDSLKQVLTNNPQAKVVTNTAVGSILQKENIAFEILENGMSRDFFGVAVEGFGTTHAGIYKDITPVHNTGFFIAGKVFYPGDSLTMPGKPIDILALPVAGPWIKISEAIEYGLAVHPRMAFPVHDGMLKITTPFHKLPEKFLNAEGIEFKVFEEGKEYDV